MQDELHRSGRHSAAVDTVSILKTVDEAIDDEREYVKKVSKQFITLDVLMTILTFTVAFGNFLTEYAKDVLNQVGYNVWFEIFAATLNGGNAAILAYASWSIRKSILT